MRINGEELGGWSELLAEARAGSGQALGQLFEQFRPLLLQIANEAVESALRAKGGASDLVQESFLEAQRDFAGFRGCSRLELMNWLCHILQHNLLDFARQYHDTAKRQLGRELTANPTQEPAAPDPSPSKVVSDAEQAERVRRVLNKLGEEQRRAIQLRHEEGRTFAEIGELLGRSEEAARKVWARAIEELREYLRDEHDSTVPAPP